MKYFIETYGCQMNVADSELLAGLLSRAGYERSPNLENAHILLLNTCSIREKAEDTVLSRLDQLVSWKRQNPARIIGVVGCMAKNLADQLLESRPYVDLILGPDSYRKLPEMIANRGSSSGHLVDTELSRVEVYEDLVPTRADGINAWIPIMRGCDKFCTFCIVPFTRGRERSNPVVSIIADVKRSVEQGFLEFTLLGQNVNSYNFEGMRFPDLLDTVAQIDGVRRLRYTSPHPSDIDNRLLQVMAAHNNICNSIHLPLQAGSDRILKRMNRTYTRAEFIALAEKIRATLPGCTLSTDVIVGFPGETQSEFAQTLDVLVEVSFDSAFMFKYSARPGTKAAEYSDSVPVDVKQERLEELIQLQKAISLARNRSCIGSVYEVLVEKQSKKSSAQWAGRTEENRWVVFDKGSASVKDFVHASIDESHGVALKGHIITPQEA